MWMWVDTYVFYPCWYWSWVRPSYTKREDERTESDIDCTHCEHNLVENCWQIDINDMNYVHKIYIAESRNSKLKTISKSVLIHLIFCGTFVSCIYSTSEGRSYVQMSKIIDARCTMYLRQVSERSKHYLLGWLWQFNNKKTELMKKKY